LYVRHLSVTDFRSWPAAEVPFEPGPSVLVGPNGEGKTNLVEALGYVATLGSHRVATDAPLVREGAARAVVRTVVVNAGRELLVELEINPGRANRARLNRSPVPRPREVLGALRSVLFAPEDLALVRGDPGERRRFLDELLVQRAPRYAGVRSDYERVLKQRGALLKSARAHRGTGAGADLRTLDVWDGHLAAHGAALLAGRLELVAAIAPPAVEAFAEVAPSSPPIALTYRCSVDTDAGPLEAALLEALARVRRGPRVGLLTDAFALPEFASAILNGLASPTQAGEIRFEPTSRMAETFTVSGRCASSMRFASSLPTRSGAASTRRPASWPMAASPSLRRS